MAMMATQFLIKLGLKFDIYDLWSRALLWSVQPWADRSAESIPSNEWLGSSNLSYLWESFNRWNAHCTNNSDYYLYKSYSQKLRIQEPRYYGVFFFFLFCWVGPMARRGKWKPPCQRSIPNRDNGSGSWYQQQLSVIPLQFPLS